MHTCRVCSTTEYDKSVSKFKLIQYAVRHWVHPDCALKKWGAAFFDRLTPWQCYNLFPVKVAREAGLMDELEARVKIAQEQENARN